MRTKSILGATFGLAGLFASSPAFASGYLLYEASAQGMAQGGAVIADGTEAAAVFYNPAGITQLDGFNAQVSLTTYFESHTTFTGPSGVTEKAKATVFPLPTLFATYKATDWMTVGIGGYSAYGLGVDWNAGWSGTSLVTKAQLTSYSIQPTLAFGSFAGFSAGVGLDVLLGAVDISRGIGIADGNYGSVRLGGSAAAVGFNAGLMYEPANWVKLGVTFRSPIKINLNSGKADFTVPPVLQESLRDQGMKTSLKTPPTLGFGARFKPVDNLQLEIDGTYIGWSTYDHLDFTFDDPTLNTSQDKSWKNSFQIRTGGQYDIGRGAVRAGFIFDKNPIPDRTLDPLLPDSDRLDFSVGGGYTFGPVKVDLAYMFVYLLPRTVGDENPFPGTYRVYAHVLNIGASIHL